MSVLAVSKDGMYVELPAPAYQGYSTVDRAIVKADRNTQGNAVIQRINVKANMTLEWHAMSYEQKNLIIGSTDENTFNIRYLSMMDDSVKYGKFYRGDYLEISAYGKFDGSHFRYYNIKMTLVEL